MYPYLHKYLATTPPLKPIDVDFKSATKHKRHSSKKRAQNNQSANCKSSVTPSSDTVHTHFSPKPITHLNKLGVCSEVKNDENDSDDDGILDDSDHKYQEEPLSNTSPVLFIETGEDLLGSVSSKKTIKSAMYKYWTLSITSSHSNSLQPVSGDQKSNDSEPKAQRIVFGFVITQITDKLPTNDLSTDQLLMICNHGWGHTMTFREGHKYESYHAKLKSMDDILISYNMLNRKLILWQNGKKFSKIFQLFPNCSYAFGVKLYGNDYSIKVTPNTGQ